MKVNVQMSMLADPDFVPVELTADSGLPKGWMVTTVPEGKVIGRVYKDSYTNSPPAAGHGGRIARHHARISSWSSETQIDCRRFLRCRTRREALVCLIKAHRAVAGVSGRR